MQTLPVMSVSDWWRSLYSTSMWPRLLPCLLIPVPPWAWHRCEYESSISILKCICSAYASFQLSETMAVYLLTKHSSPQTLDACCFPRQSVLIQACISLCTLELSVLLAVGANVRIPATIKCAPWPFTTIVQHAYLHCCSLLVRCWPRWLWSWPLPRSLAVVWPEGWPSIAVNWCAACGQYSTGWLVLRQIVQWARQVKDFCLCLNDWLIKLQGLNMSRWQNCSEAWLLEDQSNTKCCHSIPKRQRAPVTDVLTWVQCFTSLASVL